MTIILSFRHFLIAELLSLIEIEVPDIQARLFTVLLGCGSYFSCHTRLVVHGCTIPKIIGNQTAIIQFLHAAGWHMENN